MTDILNDERLLILAAARQAGFDYHESNDGRLTCTIDQLITFSASVATATAEQIIKAFDGVKKE